MAPDGSAVFVTGAGTSVNTEATVAYNPATGVPLWTAPAAIVPGSIAVSPDGSRVFVTGVFGTQAYNAATGASLWTVRSTRKGAARR